MIKIKLVIDDRDLVGAKLPKWYGFAWREHDVRRTVLIIIPLNIIVRYARKVFYSLYYFLYASGWRDELDKSYWRGFNDGNTTREAHYDRLARILMGRK